MVGGLERVQGKPEGGGRGILGKAAQDTLEVTRSWIGKKLAREAAAMFARWAIRLGSVRSLALRIHQTIELLPFIASN